MTIIALVGTSGSGKSHRASMVADRYVADAILDDGLLIVDGRIVAGHSAKSEVTRMAAVKRAILLEPAHAEEIRMALSLTKPRRLLVLGTSRNMIARIVQALQAESAPIEWVAIESVASEEEIRAAKRERSLEGKHVIPAPTLEVQKTFSGYWVAPLQFIFFHRGRGRRITVEKSIVRPTYSSFGRFYIADTVLSAIAAHAAEECPGVQAVSRVVVHTETNGVRLRLDMHVKGGHDLFQVLAAAQAAAERWVAATTSLNVISVSVNAQRITLPTRPEGRI